MTYDIADIRQAWLGDGRVAYSDDELVAEFNRVEAVFGRPWMEAKRSQGEVESLGAIPTIMMVRQGVLLREAERATNTEVLYDRLRQERPDALSELKALYLLGNGRDNVEMEVDPIVAVGTRQRMPDSRVRVSADDPWTYVEVTRADDSLVKKQVRLVMDEFKPMVDEIEGRYALEIFLRREPTPEEVRYIWERAVELCGQEQVVTEELPQDLGTLYMNHSEPGLMILDDHGEPYRSGLGLGMVLGAPNDPHRHVVLRVPYADERADAFLESEAKQLPKGVPGVIMIDVAQATDAMRGWETLLRARLQPRLHTRVGAVCLFRSGSFGDGAGERWRIETTVIVNPHAADPVPDWVVDQLQRHTVTNS